MMNSFPSHELAVVPSEEAASLIAVVVPHFDASQHPVTVYLASLAPRSRRTIAGDLKTLAHMLSSGRLGMMEVDWGSLRYAHAAALRSALAQRYSYSTANRMLSALRGVLKAAWRLGQMPTEEYHRAIDIPPVRGETLPRGRALSSGELRILFASCADGKNSGVRDQALLAVLYGCGLRRSEAVALDVEDYDGEEATLRVLAGKGNKQRLVHLPPGAKHALDRWIWLRENTLSTQEWAQNEETRDGEEGTPDVPMSTQDTIDIYKEAEDDSANENLAEKAPPVSTQKESSAAQRHASPSLMRRPLFVPILKSRSASGGKMLPRRLTDQSVLYILTRRAQQAGLKKTSPHDFRRTFISDLLDAGADIATVQKMAGHANVTTTARYDRRGERARKKAAELLHVPTE